jgi:hypothetical protein
MPEMYYAKGRTTEGRRGGNRKENDMRVWVKRDHSILGTIAREVRHQAPSRIFLPSCLWSSKAQHRRGSFSLSLYVLKLSQTQRKVFSSQLSHFGVSWPDSSTHFRDSTPKSATGGCGTPGNGQHGGETPRHRHAPLNIFPGLAHPAGECWFLLCSGFSLRFSVPNWVFRRNLRLVDFNFWVGLACVSCFPVLFAVFFHQFLALLHLAARIPLSFRPVHSLRNPRYSLHTPRT